MVSCIRYIAHLTAVWVLFGTMVPYESNGDVSVEQLVRNAVDEDGYTIGGDPDREAFVFVGRTIKRMPMSANSRGIQLLREKCHKVAELKAKSELLRYLRQNGGGGEYVRVAVGNGMVNKEIGAVYSAFAKEQLSGCRVLHSAEKIQDGVYSVAVAVIWSLKLEEAGRLAREGRMQASGSYAKELSTWLDAQDVGSWCGVRTYVDSVGFPHVLGIGVSDVSSDSDLCRRAARMTADGYARKNLLMGLFGDMEIQRTAKSRIENGTSKTGGHDSVSIYEDLASVTVKDVVVNGMMPVYERLFVHPLTSRKMLMVIYGAVPQRDIGARLNLKNMIHKENRKWKSAESSDF